MIIPLSTVYLWMLIMCRCTGLLAGFPFGGKDSGIPNIPKVFLACCVSFIALTVLPKSLVPPESLNRVIVLAIREVLIGIGMGLVIKIAFSMIEMTGYLIASEVGLNTSEHFDPLTENSTTFTSTLLVQFAIVFFFITGLDKEILRVFLESYQIVNFETFFPVDNGMQLIDFTAQIFSLSLKISAPLMVLNFLINFGFAILGKAAPKINVFFLSFPLRIFAGLCLFNLLIYLIYVHMSADFEKIPQRIWNLIHP